MSRAPRRVYTLSEEQYQSLNDKAVALTSKLKEPVSCRRVLDAFLSLGLNVDEPALTHQIQKQFNTTRGRPRKHGRRVE
ncbi:hypothetical protein [Enterobacter asburiae]|uniref:hypothetical protein n=1 Tax=Enterobacter asburiae TaxID=61645 RepID=UPI003F57E79E